MKEKYNIFNEVGSLEFYLYVKKNKDDNTVYTLKHSYEGEWNNIFKGKKIIKVTDTGNGFKIKPYNFNINDMSEDYSGVSYLYLILKCINDIDTDLDCNYSMVKEK